MIRSVDFISKLEAQQLAASQDRAMISINGMLAIAPRLNQCYRLLSVEFEDVRQSDAFGAFKSQQAQAIVDFVAVLHEEPKAVDLIVHCKAGVSRSAAVARYVADTTDCLFPRQELSEGANPLVLAMLARPL
jgi:predicted protein tyrosine phosphatase